MDWIKTSERLPEKGFKCFVFALGYIQMAHYKYQDGTWWVLHDMGVWCTSGIQEKITHWAEIEPPKD